MCNSCCFFDKFWNKWLTDWKWTGNTVQVGQLYAGSHNSMSLYVSGRWKTTLCRHRFEPVHDGRWYTVKKIKYIFYRSYGIWYDIARLVTRWRAMINSITAAECTDHFSEGKPREAAGPVRLSCPGLFRFVFSHRILLNQSKSAGFRISRTPRELSGHGGGAAHANSQRDSDRCVGVIGWFYERTWTVSFRAYMQRGPRPPQQDRARPENRSTR